MSKAKIILPDNFYITDSKYGYFNIIPNQLFLSDFAKIIADKNKELIFNFSDKKDRRQIETKKANPINLNFRKFFGKNVPNCDLTFNQTENTNSYFDFCLSSDYNYTEEEKKYSYNDNTFTLNGCFKNLSLYTGPSFRHYNIKKFIPDIFNDTKNYTRSKDTTLIFSEYNNAETFSYSAPDTLNINELYGPKLKTIDFDVKKTIYVPLQNNKVFLPNIESINFHNCNTLYLSAEGADLKNFFDLSLKHSSYGDDFLSHWASHFNPNCKLFLSPVTTITSYELLPEIYDPEKHYSVNSIKVKNLFDKSKFKSKSNQYVVSPYDLIQTCWKLKKNTLLQQLENSEKQLISQHQEIIKNKQNIKEKENVKTNSITSK